MAGISPQACPFPLPDGKRCDHPAYVHSVGEIFDGGVAVGGLFVVRCGRHSQCAASGPVDNTRDGAVVRWNAVRMTLDG